MSALAADDGKKSDKVSSVTDGSKDATSTYHHKKILHLYNQGDQEFTEIHEGIFSAGGSARKQSMDNLDD